MRLAIRLHAGRADHRASICLTILIYQPTPIMREFFCTVSIIGPTDGTFIPPGAKIPYGESSMWGDYHLLEALLLVAKLADSSYYTFF